MNQQFCKLCQGIPPCNKCKLLIDIPLLRQIVEVLVSKWKLNVVCTGVADGINGGCVSPSPSVIFPVSDNVRSLVTPDEPAMGGSHG